MYARDPPVCVSPELRDRSRLMLQLHSMFIEFKYARLQQQ